MLFINSFVTCLKVSSKWSFSYFQPILTAIFVTIALIKVESMSDFNTLAIVLVTNKKKLVNSSFLLFDFIGGGPK